ncbi:MAG: response regulator [Chloroflexota bacterium]
MAQATILVVEDDVNLLEGIRDILELEAYHILTAENGLDALEVLQQAPATPDLIVSDIMMPQMDGIDFLKRVREIEQYVAIPFIYLTAKGEKADIQRGKELGVDDYVVKPFNADDLLVAIRSRLDRSRALQRVQQGQQDELKKSILTILNHEFRTPLTFIVAYSDMLTDVQPNGNGSMPEDGEMLTFLEGVRNGADRLRRLIENFIMLVEIQTGQANKNFEWRKRPIENVGGLVRHAAERAVLIPEEERNYELDIEPDLPTISADEDYLRAAIIHMIDNAFKFSEPPTPVKISTKVADGCLHISVTDEGRGIPDEEMEHIWTGFYQINRAHFEDQGAGSGLAIVKGVAELHGGNTSVKSDVGVGSTFTMSLPL